MLWPKQQKRDANLLSSDGTHLNQLINVPKKGAEGEIWINSENFLYEDPILDETSIYTIGTDVTDVIAARDDAEDTLAQLVLLQQIAKVGFWSLDLEDESVFWSEEVYRIHGEDPKSYSPNFNEGLDYYHPDDRAKQT